MAGGGVGAPWVAVLGIHVRTLACVGAFTWLVRGLVGCHADKMRDYLD